jgi:hypothetical protein
MVARCEGQAQVLEDIGRSSVVAEPHVPELDARMRGRRTRVGRFGHRRRGVHDLERPDRGRAAELDLAERVTEGLHRLVGRERDQRQRGEEHPLDPPVANPRDREREHREPGRAGQDRAGPGAGPPDRREGAALALDRP